jgi:hypothetical protein
LLISAAQSGSRRQLLEALRDAIAEKLDEGQTGRDFAALSKRLLETCAELDSLPDENDASPLAQARRSEYAR